MRRPATTGRHRVRVAGTHPESDLRLPATRAVVVSSSRCRNFAAISPAATSCPLPQNPVTIFNESGKLPTVHRTRLRRRTREQPFTLSLPNGRNSEGDKSASHENHLKLSGALKVRYRKMSTLHCSHVRVPHSRKARTSFSGHDNLDHLSL